MSVMIQIRNVPEPLHRKLKVQAASAGMSLSDFLLREIAATADMPTADEMRERLRGRAPVELPLSPADMLRQERDRA